MAKVKKNPTSDHAVDGGVSLLIVREGTLIGLLVVAAFCLFALFSYDPQDPGWSATGAGTPLANSMGPTGAWVADIAYSFLGYSAFIVPLMLIYRSWLIFKDRYEPLRLDWLTIGTKAAGGLLMLLGFTCLFALTAVIDHQSLPFGGGGWIGRRFAEGLQASLGGSGSVLMTLAVSLFGITLFAEVSWLKVMDVVGEGSMRLVNFGFEHGRNFYERRVEVWHQYQHEKHQRLEALAEMEEAQRAEVAIHRDAAGEEYLEVVRQSEASKPLLNHLVDNVKQTASTVIPRIQRGMAPAENAAQGGVDPEAQKSKKKAPTKRLFSNMGDMDTPSYDLLDMPDENRESGYSDEELADFSTLLELKLADFGISAEVKSVMPGPVITRFEIQPAPGVKVSRISNLVKDLARSLAVISVRVVEVIPGKSFVGIEIPNINRAMVFLSEVLLSDVYQKALSPLTLALGHDIAGQPIVADLAKMPHLLVAGTTGSGKSVGVNAMLLSLLYKSTPSEVRLILIDPKMLELNVYEGIPHLLSPVITDMKDAANGLRWCVAEMERRYRLMAALGVRNMAGFNKKVSSAIDAGEPMIDPIWQPDMLSIVDAEDQIPPNLDTLPAIVVVIDEFADMMMIVGKKVEQLIARIAQKARAAGIHLVLATQRPSVDVITGLIKANVPTRIGFQVSSRIDSRTILDQGGAEQLLGHGDMLYLPPGSGMPMRVHGAFVSDEEVHRVCDDWRSRGEPDYIPSVTEGASADDLGAASGLSEERDDEADELYDQAVKIVTETRRASISSVQRRLRIGYNRAARMIETMEAAGVVTEMQSNGSREVIAPPPPR